MCNTVTYHRLQELNIILTPSSCVSKQYDKGIYTGEVHETIYRVETTRLQ